MRKNAVILKPKETNSFWLQCNGKQRYTKKEAVTAAKAAAYSGRVKKMGYYECDFCKGWHLTHIKKEDLWGSFFDTYEKEPRRVLSRTTLQK